MNNEMISPEVTASAPDRAQQLYLGLEVANGIGFDLLKATAASMPEGVTTEQVAARTMNVLERTVAISDELRLDTKFFDKPANTVLLTAIAASWEDSEAAQNASDADHTKISRQRDMLVDTAMILAGDSSEVVRDLSDNDERSRNRYIGETDDPDVTLWNDFFEQRNQKELAEAVSEVFADRSQGSFLEGVRETMGLDATNEVPIKVQVFMSGSQLDLIRAGAIKPIERPSYVPGMTDTEIDEMAAVHKQADEQQAEIQDFVRPAFELKNEYAKRFGKKFGPLPDAFVTRDTDGTPILRMPAVDAYTLLNYTGEGKQLPSNSYDAGWVSSNLAQVKHEFSHTQKPMDLGARKQLGSIIEERKAELISGDHPEGGYQDLKGLFFDIMLVKRQNTLKVLKDAVQQPDALGSFVSTMATKVGLRATLMLMASHPRNYDYFKHQVQHYPDVKSAMSPQDTSAHDAIVRELLEANGDEKIKTASSEWAAIVAESIASGTPVNFGLYFLERRRNGSKYGTDYLERAISHHTGIKDSLDNDPAS